MTLRSFAVLSLVVLCFGAAHAAESARISPEPARAVPGETPRARMFINGVLDTGQFLPDTTILCQVGPRVTRARDFVELYFYSYAEDRPNSDSLGRVQFLNTLVNKDLLGLIARELNPPMRFEDRSALREFQERMLSNLLFERAVSDSAKVTEADLEREYQSYKVALRVRRIIFDDLGKAERVRGDLQRGRIAWKQAYDKYCIVRAKDKNPDGEQGWLARGSLDLLTARKVFSLGTMGISEPIAVPNGFSVLQVLERREITPVSLDAVRAVLRDEISAEKAATRSREIRGLVRKQIGMVYDSTNIAWAAAHFVEVRNGESNEIRINVSLPEFAPGDTAKVLARYRGGQMTLGNFFSKYSEIQPLVRPSVNSYDKLREQVDGFVFEPHMARIASERGLEKDPEYVRRLDQKREQIMVDHLYQDSVMSRVAVTSKGRRQYYDQHVRDFVTYAHVRFASLWAQGRPAADSLANLLRKGQDAQEIIRADSLLGIQRGSIQERSQEERFPNKRVVMEELKPGQVTITGPDKEGAYIIYQSLAYVPGRQLSYAEAELMIDESLQNQEAERLLKGFIERHRKKYPTTMRPDLVMRIKLVDPSVL